jgi:hypothetical protein
MSFIYLRCSTPDSPIPHDVVVGIGIGIGFGNVEVASAPMNAEGSPAERSASPTDDRGRSVLPRRGSGSACPLAQRSQQLLPRSGRDPIPQT